LAGCWAGGAEDFLRLIGLAVVDRVDRSRVAAAKMLEDFAYRHNMSGWFLVAAAVCWQ